MQMRSAPNYFSNQIGFCQRYGIDAVNNIINSKNFSQPLSTAEVKVLAAKKHSESERRRRMRINSQYAALRKILPNLIKMDKAAVLSETVRQVRELKKVVAEIEAACRGSECVIPSGINKLSLEKCEGNKQEGLVKATFSCEDRPGLISDLTKELRSGKGRVVRAEMVTVGGRTKSVLWVKGLAAGSEGIVCLKKALNKVIVDRPSNIIIQKLRTSP